MKLRLNLPYRTVWGERLIVEGDIPELHDGVAMESHEAGLWTADVEVSPQRASVTYRYAVVRDDGSRREEWHPDRTLRFDPMLPVAVVYDRWSDRPENAPMYSTAFTDCVCRRQKRGVRNTLSGNVLRIEVNAPELQPWQVLAISGSVPALGEWNPANAIRLSDIVFPSWSVDLPVDGLDDEFEFKFVVLDRDSGHLVWEPGENRRFAMPRLKENGSVVMSGLRLREGALKRWRGAGVAIPVFSLRSEADFGTGDFYDIMPLVDWAVKTGQKFIQLLPVNDTTTTGAWTDSYPYNAISTIALHPMYLRLEAVGNLADPLMQAEMERMKNELNALEDVDYERVNRAKALYSKALFAQQGASDMSAESFAAFFNANKNWLTPYAVFCVLRDMYGTPDYSKWKELSVFDAGLMADFISTHKNEVDYVCWLQYHLHRQLSYVREYAHRRGVALKGDIPIGVSACSVDAWTYPGLFNLDASAGAPPDDFSVLGQNWGFPTYNWVAMAADGYSWWKERLRKMAEYFDAYRIDHVLGFFRIWQIPRSAVHGLLGFFNSALPMTPKEMLSEFGFEFKFDSYTKPYITDAVVDDIFGSSSEEIKSKYLLNSGDGFYNLRPEVDTQQKVAALLWQPECSDVREGLMQLIDDVLFIEDPYRSGCYHPRISAWQTHVWRNLDYDSRKKFDALYENFFYHRHNDFWREKAMDKLPPLINSTRMLVCAEDLGMIPVCVPAVMDELDILSLEIQRMPKTYGVAFEDTLTYPYLSVCTTSTHDMPGIRGWWEMNHEVSGRYYREVLGHHDAVPAKATPELCEEIVSVTLQSPSMLCILPLQDWLAIDGRLRRDNPAEEQINEPSNPRNYWHYRMHLTLESLIASESLNKKISDLITSSQR